MDEGKGIFTPLLIHKKEFLTRNVVINVNFLNKICEDSWTTFTTYHPI